MKTDTKTKILKLTENGMSPNQLAQELKITSQALHRHLKLLTESGAIQKVGTAPFVVYIKSKNTTLSHSFGELSNSLQDFCYFTPAGKELNGSEGFYQFLINTNQDQKPIDRANEYISILEKAKSFRDSGGLIDSTEKISSTFDENFLNKVYIADFYSLPKYGKTKLGQYLLFGKSGQSKRLIRSIADSTSNLIKTIIEKEKIDAVCFVPHSIPRKIQFLPEYKKLLNLNIPMIELKKAFAGEPIAQKSLSKLSERIENARSTIYLLNSTLPFKRVLIIDDAIGSGATINEIARKLISSDRKIFGFAIVGSYKGFEVIREI